MPNPISELQRIGLKVFVDGAAALKTTEFVPVFHRWIQTHAVDDMLIDVADYAHVPQGPGTMLIAHAGNYSTDQAGGRMGLLYTRKRGGGDTLEARLTSLARTVLHAARLLEQDPAFSGRLSFRGSELELTANDRLLAPNSDETVAALRPALSAVLGALYPGAECRMVRDPDPRARLTLSITAPQPVSIATLLGRLS